VIYLWDWEGLRPFFPLKFMAILEMAGHLRRPVTRLLYIIGEHESRYLLEWGVSKKQPNAQASQA
jgi:hypothetical protein